MSTNSSLYELEEERVVPWGDPGLFAWHRARYAFALPYVEGKRVLDVGCGEGYGAALLAERAREVVAVDYSPAAIEHAQATYARPNLRFEVADARELPPELAGFDIVICFELVEHLDEPDRLLASLARALDSGGTLLLSTPNAVVDRLFGAFAGHEHYPYHVNLMSPRSLRRAVLPWFSGVRLYGQYERGGWLHALLKAVDVLNLRHRLLRSRRAQRALASVVGKGDPKIPALAFSRLLVRPSPALMLVATRR